MQIYRCIESVHFLNDSLDNLIKDLGENDYHLLIHEVNAGVLGLVKKKGISLSALG